MSYLKYIFDASCFRFLFGRRASIRSTAEQGLTGVSCFLLQPKPASPRYTLLVRCWSIVVDGGPALNREVLYLCLLCMYMGAQIHARQARDVGPVLGRRLVSAGQDHDDVSCC